MLGLLETDRAVGLVTYALSSLAIYWGCKRSVANDSRTTISRANPIHRDQMSGLRPNSTSWGAIFLFVASVIVGVGLLGVLSHLIVYLTSRTLQNRCFAIAAIAQGTVAIYRLLGETISANSHRLPAWDSLSKLRAAIIPLAFGLSVGLVLGVYNGHRWVQGVLVAIIIFSAVWISTIVIGGSLFAGFIFLSNDYITGRSPTLNDGHQGNEHDSPEVKLIFAMNIATMTLLNPGVLLATTLQYEHSKAEDREEKLEILPWRFKVDTTLYSAASKTFYFEMILLSAAEILAPPVPLRVARIINVICAPSALVVMRLVLLARRGGIYEEYMSYPTTEPSGENVEGSQDVEAVAR